jgi:hypothetical protein
MRRLGQVLLGFCLAAAVLLIPQPAFAADVVITNPPPSPVTPHVPFSHQFIATGGIAPYTFTLGTPPFSLTSGLSLSSDGLLSGTPDTPGTWIFTVLATDAFDTVAALNVTMVVNAPVITMTPPPSPIPALVDFSHTFPSGGKAPYTLTHVGALPSGMGLDPPGVLVGIPQQTGTFTFTVRATDAQGFKSDDLAVTLVVVPPTIVVAPAPVSPIYTGQPFTHTFTATGALGTKTFSLPAGSLPPGLTLTSAGVLAGTPTTAGTYPFTIRGTTTFGPLSFSGDQAFTITVAAPSTGFTSSPPPGGVVSVPYSFSFTAAGDAGITFSLTGGALPPGLVLAPDGLLSGTPTTAGTYAFVIKATGLGSSAEQNASVTIVPLSTPSPSAPPGQPGPTMPATGLSIVAYVVAGGLMLVAGLVLVSVARRRARP